MERKIFSSVQWHELHKWRGHPHLIQLPTYVDFREDVPQLGYLVKERPDYVDILYLGWPVARYELNLTDHVGKLSSLTSVPARIRINVATNRSWKVTTDGLFSVTDFLAMKWVGEVDWLSIANAKHDAPKRLRFNGEAGEYLFVWPADKENQDEVHWSVCNAKQTFKYKWNAALAVYEVTGDNSCWLCYVPSYAQYKYENNKNKVLLEEAKLNLKRHQACKLDWLDLNEWYRKLEELIVSIVALESAGRGFPSYS